MAHSFSSSTKLENTIPRPRHYSENKDIEGNKKEIGTAEQNQKKEEKKKKQENNRRVRTKK